MVFIVTSTVWTPGLVRDPENENSPEEETFSVSQSAEIDTFLPIASDDLTSPQ